MNTLVSLHPERPLSLCARAILVLEERPPHRPVSRYRLQLESQEDVDRARAEGFPVYLLTSRLVTMLGYPISFPSRLLVASVLTSAVSTPFARSEFLSSSALLRPGVEDIVVALLKFDVLAARAVFLRNRDLLDDRRMLKRILQEDVEEEATLVRLHEQLPFVPQGRMLDAAGLQRHDRSNLPGGLLP
ncbi:MAG: hypothetical protein KGJ23_12395 [Euryarchaeota archaeon]|nr:hypothetical protein [Euryarchaeota archaeon]MDE1837397.1 hypothetical protein [Euryarchaeota archaeon]MDE1879920.1 hypothetical protein [Euryarchaeota archaeon]MDE2045503.1 hypothetical protein [Thermoplasmata archaeon]